MNSLLGEVGLDSVSSKLPEEPCAGSEVLSFDEQTSVCKAFGPFLYLEPKVV